MPRVKIDYVVSFSSEDPEHPANNLLAWEVSKKKWLCKKGESSCSVVLQLTKAVKISSVHIGAYHSALVEVLVARSEKGSEQYQVLVPSCVFVPPTESRRDVPVERVRSFSAEQLAAAARDQRWDRVRVVCSQPYNKHCKYGLSFIHIDEPGGPTAAAPAPATLPAAQPAAPPSSVPGRMLALDTFSSDEDEFRPGELFAQHLQTHSDSQTSAADTGAQIRQATSQALKNIPESSTKLMKTPISKPGGKRPAVPATDTKSDRTRDTLMYTDDDERPHAKIDQVVQRHIEQKQKEEKHEKKYSIPKNKDITKLERPEKKGKDETRTPKRRKSDSPPSETPPNKKSSKDVGEASSSGRKNRTDDRRKRARLSSEDNEQESEESSEPHTIMKDVVLVLSGYENPQRAHVRNTALAMGARVQRDWGPDCTHLICAFPNTPKLRQVRAAGGSTVPIVLADWVLQCSARRRRLPWQWFATEPQHRRPEPPRPKPVVKVKKSPPSQPEPTKRDDDTDCDTDDEIEKVLQKQKAKLTSSDDQSRTSPTHSAQLPAPETLELEGPSTDDEGSEDAVVPRFGGALPDFFDGHSFVIDADDEEAETLARYVKAYGGLVLQASQLEEDSEVEYIVSTRPQCVVQCAGARVVPAAWLARCRRAGALLPPD